jgi:SlyX protein
LRNSRRSLLILSLNERIQLLEEKIAYLERHVTAQDRAMLEMVEETARLRRELGALRQRIESPGPGTGEPSSPADERPPHY